MGRRFETVNFITLGVDAVALAQCCTCRGLRQGGSKLEFRDRARFTIGLSCRRDNQSIRRIDYGYIGFGHRYTEAMA